MIAVVAFYLGLIVSVVSLFGVVRRPKRPGSRMRAALMLCAGLVVAGAGLTYPPTESFVSSPRSQLDEFMPVFQFSEVHSIQVSAAPSRVYQAIKDVTPDEIAFFKVLTWARRFG